MSQKPSLCPACSATNRFTEDCRASFLPGDERTLLTCTSCRLGILWPLPTGDELTTYYHQAYYDFNRAREEGKGLYYASLLRRLAPRGRFIDVGCATGFFLSGIQKHCSWELFGLETGREAAAYARKNLGIDIKDVPLEEADYEANFFDYIHLNNVLEHTLDPLAVLQEASRILKPGGTLFVAIPNGPIDQRGYRKVLAQSGRPGASKDGHLYFFSGESLRHLVRRSGLKFTRVRSSGLKRALRVVGAWPQKRGWEISYQGRPNDHRSVENSVQEGKKHSDSYYLWKHAEEDLFQFPGFFPYTYDFNLNLSK